MEDYAANRKGPQAGGTATPFGAAAGQPQATASFGGFGGAQNKTFGGGATTTGGFTGGTTGLFGQTQQPQQTTGLFGSAAKPTAFGTPVTSAGTFGGFGATAGTASTSLFGQNTQNKSLFVTPAATTQATSLFGNTATPASTGGFGATATSTGFGGFGQTVSFLTISISLHRVTIEFTWLVIEKTFRITFNMS